MNADLKHRELTKKIIGVFYEVYNELGHGFFGVGLPEIVDSGTN